MNELKNVVVNSELEESTVTSLAMDKLDKLEMAGKVRFIYQTPLVTQQQKEVTELYEELRAIFNNNPRALELLIELEDRETDLASLLTDKFFTLGYSNGMKFIRNLYKELDEDVQ